MTTTGAEMRRRLHLSNGVSIVAGHGPSTGVGINQVVPVISNGFPQEASTEPVSHAPAESTPTPLAISTTRRPTHATLASISTATTLAMKTTPVPVGRCSMTMTSAERRRCNAPPAQASTSTLCSITMSNVTTTTRRPTPVTRGRCYRAMTSALTRPRPRPRPLRQLRLRRRCRCLLLLFRGLSAVLLAVTV